MKTVLRVLVFLAALATPTLSATTAKPREEVSFYRGSGKAVGAAYFLSNELDTNYIIALDIEKNGTLTLRKAYYTGGAGAHGISIVGPDPIFSQGSIISSYKNNLLMTVNAGSATVTTFRIDPTDPINLKRLGKPVPSGGDFPAALTMNKDGNIACILNGGKINGVSCFKVDAKKGLPSKPFVTRLMNINQTTPATGPRGSVGDIEYNEDESKLMVVVKGFPDTPDAPASPGSLWTWDVNKDWTLSEKAQVIPAGQFPWSITNIPGKNAFISADAGTGFDIFTLEDCRRNTTIKQYPIPKEQATCWTGWSEVTGNYYTTDLLTPQVTEIHVDDNLNATIVRIYPQEENDGTIEFDIATIDQKDYMYVLAANVTAVEVLALNTPGQAERIQKLFLGPDVRAKGLGLNGDNVTGMKAYIKNATQHH